MVNISVKFHENHTCTFRQISTSVWLVIQRTNEGTNQPTNQPQLDEGNDCRHLGLIILINNDVNGTVCTVAEWILEWSEWTGAAVSSLHVRD